jgi:hypothetical protein
MEEISQIVSRFLPHQRSTPRARSLMHSPEQIAPRADCLPPHGRIESRPYGAERRTLDSPVAEDRALVYMRGRVEVLRREQADTRQQPRRTPLRGEALRGPGKPADFHHERAPVIEIEPRHVIAVLPPHLPNETPATNHIRQCGEELVDESCFHLCLRSIPRQFASGARAAVRLVCPLPAPPRNVAALSCTLPNRPRDLTEFRSSTPSRSARAS